MVKKRKNFKIPSRTGNRVTQLENRYKDNLIKLLQQLYPDENYNSRNLFQE